MDMLIDSLLLIVAAAAALALIAFAVFLAMNRAFTLLSSIPSAPSISTGDQEAPLPIRYSGYPNDEILDMIDGAEFSRSAILSIP
jgi:hypothetical protein